MTQDEEFNKGTFLDAQRENTDDEILFYSVEEEDAGVDDVAGVGFESFEDEDCVFFFAAEGAITPA